MKLVPYWLDTRTPFASAAQGPVEGRADVVVIGGGFAGLSCALELARRGTDVVLLEAGDVGGLASGRNGGQCNTGFFHDYAEIMRKYGAETARGLFHSYNAAVDEVEAIATREGIDCSFRRVGKLKLAMSPAAFDGFRKYVDLVNREADPEVYTVPAKDIRSEIGSDMFHGGVIYPRSGMLHVGRFTVGMAEAAVRHGARIHTDTPVTGLVRLNGHRHRVETARGTIEADRVVVATGISAKGPFGWFRRRIVPIGSFVIATEQLPQAMIDSVIPNHRTVTVAKGLGHYYRISPDNRIIFGGRAQFAISSPKVDVSSGDILVKSMKEIHPQLRDVKIDYCWGGMIEATRDRFARVGEHDGLFHVLGFSGSGVQEATHMGTEVARMLCGDTIANPYRALPWPAIPGHFGTPWFLPLVGAWYKAKEIMGR
ncbi:Glycine/D-amino acid oxidase [Gemmobacter megaterium]|uniref:Glycine/D-amino acid oxidase n=1 Tax=Gemmobacter megaterium TaxID=1086013 RepID=A0A1N7NG36_9RHOB|nr:FAD-binding oxidoreductase [Gemmobacter megaterium]GGE14932.1 oxidoreductase [Gemmobacter megaterium]SIS97198.1 Glycine/D-amino acid oxidase [Gemmobacter megaterium]